mmetsp:Transcript_41375/g.89473  ORF Transcript_41375/g.89473 Transcript_41375/m.89473 type:complete len:883 (-) Transcript_41375:301-2949(-)|eukprot:CAMPEP_0206497912 /NCGR_PEP_ID=MMETSP0324_2-20121206/50578_1 /ASSEMBLY_ACC=CAM_ASM_000836 /TAXON_ID=2866 /ORGANISM="Crypthecodinium cohnii, Strain Seligo" /LENGTH=882 /DNA_ID=CAMNT_0053983793 /DNA_START=167 /DNA_END=2815 /DNA_ORIENTATION=+
MPDSATSCLQAAMLAIREVSQSGSAASDAGIDAWSSLKTGVNKAGRRLPEVMEEVKPEEPLVLSFIVEIVKGKSAFKKQAESITAKLLAMESWLKAAEADLALKAQLAALGPSIEPILGPPELPQQDAQSQSPSPSPRPATCPTPEGNESGASSLSEPPELAAQATSAPAVILETPHAVIPPSEPLQDPPLQLPTDHPPEVSPLDETKQMLRRCFDHMVNMGFEAEDTRSVERGMEVFSELATATNRAHFEYTRRSRPRTDLEDSSTATPGSASSSVTHAISNSSLDADFLAESFEGLPWDPRRILLFLHALREAKPIHRRRIDKTAMMLSQISSACREMVKSDQFLARWLGAYRNPADPADLVSYGFASSLRWASWHASWHWVYRRQRRDENSTKHHRRWTTRHQSLLSSSELPSDVTKHMLDGVWEAAQHCSLQRWPEENVGLLQRVGALFSPPPEEGPHGDEFHKVFGAVRESGALLDDLREDLKWMVWNMCWHVANKSKGYRQDAQNALVRAERHLQRAFRGKLQWRGVNLGGWFLLEPGPCTTFWEDLPPEAQREQCEWGACKALGREEAERRLKEHRRSYYTREEFSQMRQAGLTHVRLPFGAWCVTGPRPGEPYVGPCLEELDEALSDLQAVGMNVLLDLHGTPGGESAGAPCGHKDDYWDYRKFNAKESLEVLKTVVERYADRTCICAIEVMNEPSETFPVPVLAKYYEEAVHVVRSGGMRAGEVAVVLPIFTENRAADFLAHWVDNFSAYEDVVFDVHLYQCFGTWWSLKTLEGHMDAAKRREELLKTLPMCCVGEWSLALPVGQAKCGTPEALDIYRRFAGLQLQAYETATHGWFFWNWKDTHGIEWSFKDCLEQGLLTVPQGFRDSDIHRP